MTKLKKKLFSATPGVVKRGTVATLCTLMVGLFLVVGCKKDKSTSGGNSGGKEGEIEEPEHPINVPFTEYTLPETCQWINFDYDEKVTIINSNEKLENYITCTGGRNYLSIDFSKYTLLLAHGKAPSSVVNVSCSSLRQYSEQSYKMEVEIVVGDATVISNWHVPIIVDKVGDDSIIELIVTVKYSEL
jgi:hypothetical protein